MNAQIRDELLLLLLLKPIKDANGDEFHMCRM